MKKLLAIVGICAFVLTVHMGVFSSAHATGTYDPVVNYAPGYTYDKTKDPSYGVFPDDTCSGSIVCGSSGGGGGSHDGNRYSQKSNTSTTAGGTSSSMTDAIKALLAKIGALQAEVGNVRGEIKNLIKDGLKEGVTDEDIKEIQELLASDPELYPSGKVTGFFGPMTRDAIKKFQKRHGVAETGQIDTETKNIFNEYLNYRHGTSTPKGFFQKTDVVKHMQGRFCGHSASGAMARSVLCKDHTNTNPSCLNVIGCGSTICERARFSSQSAWEQACNNASTTKVYSDLKVKVVSGTTTVTFKMGSTTHTVVVKSKRLSEVLDAVADKLNKDLKDVNVRLVKDIKKKFSEALRNANSRIERSAQRAITHAEESIATVDADIDDADDDVDTDEAESLLDDAQELLDDAKAAFAGATFSDARKLAREADERADEAADALDAAD